MNKNAIVTGASRGIGRAIAISLAKEGYQVLCIARSMPELESLAKEHSALIPAPLDLTQPEHIDSVLDVLLQKHGPVEILVNNAGYGVRGAIEEIPLDSCRRLFEVNLFSLLHITQKVLPGMRAARKGKIINISSVAGLAATPFGGIYSASKFALEAASDALRLELHPWNIHVVLIEPGPVATNFVAAAREHSDTILDNTQSPYARFYGKLKENVQWLHKGAISAESVAQTTLKAIRASRPKARYLACKPLFALPSILRRFGPAALLDGILLKKMDIKKMDG